MRVKGSGCLCLLFQLLQVLSPLTLVVCARFHDGLEPVLGPSSEGAAECCVASVGAFPGPHPGPENQEGASVKFIFP